MRGTPYGGPHSTVTRGAAGGTAADDPFARGSFPAGGAPRDSGHAGLRAGGRPARWKARPRVASTGGGLMRIIFTICGLVAALAALPTYMWATGTPLHAAPQSVPSLTRSEPSAQWASAVTR